MNTPHSTESSQAEEVRDLGLYEQVIHSWGYEGSISKIVPQGGLIWFRCDGVQNNCLDKTKNAFLQDIIKSWGFEGVASEITEGAGLLSFEYNGVRHSCPAQLQDTHLRNIDTAHRFDLSMAGGVPDKVAVVLSF